jgi:hypothetical protein
MKRRKFVTLSGLTVTGIAGCTQGTADHFGNQNRSDNPGTEGPGSITTTIWTNTTTPDGAVAPLSVTVTRLQPGVVRMTAPDSIGIQAASGTRYMVVELSVSRGEAPSPEELALRVHGSDHPAMLETQLWKAYHDESTRYGATAGEGWLVFPIPAPGDPRSVVLTWPDGAVPIHSWSADRVPAFETRLAHHSASLSLDWRPPETVAVGEAPEHSFRVSNESAVPGRFVAAMNRVGPAIAIAPVARISNIIPPGSTETWTVTDTLDVSGVGPERAGDGEPDMTYRLHWPGGEREQGIPVRGP